MHATLEQLIVLQAQDLELRRLRQQLAEAPRRVGAAEAARAASEFALAAAKQALTKEEALRRTAELDIATHRAKSARLQKQLESATTAAQIAALEHEIAFAANAIAALEDDELASLERTDQQEAARATHDEALQANTAALEATRAASIATVRQNDRLIAAIEAERAELRALIAATDEGEALLSTYDRIAGGKGTALSEALDHKCSACQMMVRPQRWNDLTSAEHADELYHCETCGRILFFDPRRDAPVRWSPGERLNAAATGSPAPTGAKPTLSVADTPGRAPRAESA